MPASELRCLTRLLQALPSELPHRLQHPVARLEEAGEAAELGRRHAQFILARAVAADPFLPVHAGGWQERLGPDVGNLRAAADWFEQDPTAVEDKLRFTAALHWLWFA